MKRSTGTALGIIGAGVVVAAGSVVAARIGAPSRKPEIWVEVAKSGLAFGLVGLVAGVATWYLRLIDDARTRKREEISYRVGLVRELLDAYVNLKASRRRLRVFRKHARAIGEIKESDLAEFHAQMQILSDSELAIEHVEREIGARKTLFTKHAEILVELEKAKDYLRAVVSDWENGGAEMKVQDPPEKIDELTQLATYLGDASAGFTEKVANPFNKTIQYLRDDLIE